MGCFSWLDCKNKNQIKIGDKCFLLIPEEFSEEYGAKIFEGRYDGYGRFGCYDIYELSAIFNRKYINESNLRGTPQIEKFGGLWDSDKEKMRAEGKTEEEITQADFAEKKKWYDLAMNRHKKAVNRLYDFREGILSDDEMEAKYGEEWLREIGIDIACYDEQQERLLYPIKITHDKTLKYEDCKNYSLSDENQGCD